MHALWNWMYWTIKTTNLLSIYNKSHKAKEKKWLDFDSIVEGVGDQYKGPAL